MSVATCCGESRQRGRGGRKEIDDDSSHRRNRHRSFARGARGQPAAQAQERYDFKIPFNFTAGGRAFTAGQYALVSTEAQDLLTLESENPKDPKDGSVVLPVETRISERTPMAEPEVVFDKLNGQLYVSELLVPGEDGYLVLATKAKHTHQSLKGSRTKKQRPPARIRILLLESE